MHRGMGQRRAFPPLWPRLGWYQALARVPRLLLPVAPSAASSTANAITASNGTPPSQRIHRIAFTVMALVFGVLL